MQHSYKEPALSSLGRAVQTRREQRGMSVEALAEASGIPVERIGALEAGRLDPTYELLLEIADGLGSAPSELVSLAESL
jgi:transcriptional regulator with XRE-family HTH domain